MNVEIPARIGGNEEGSYEVTKIGNSAFLNCSSLTSITIPSSVTSIGNSAFWDCSSLTSITIPSSVTSIGWGAFRGCRSLTSVMFQDTQENPSQLSTIEGDAFHTCTSLRSITLPSSVASIADGSVFNDSDVLTTINVDSNNSNYCSVDGVLYNKNKTELVRYPEGKGGPSFEISRTVTEIGDWAFGNCSNLTSITIPSSVTSIGRNAFNSCRNLERITIPCNFDKSKFDDTGINVLEDRDTFSNGTKPGAFTYSHEYVATYRWEQRDNTWACTATRVCVNGDSRMEGLGPVTVAGYSGEYDENPHGITVTGEIPGATILYSTDEGNNKTWKPGIPEYTDAGKYTVYVKIHDNETFAESEEVQVTIKIIGPGDVNGDGFINIFDLQKLYNHVAGVSELNNEQEHRAELDGNGIINSGDLQSLFNIIVAS